MNRRKFIMLALVVGICLASGAYADTRTATGTATANSPNHTDSSKVKLSEKIFFGGEVSAVGEPRKVKTKYLQAEIWPATGLWRVTDDALNSRLETVRPMLHLAGETIDLSSYSHEYWSSEVEASLIGPATQVTLQYRKANGLAIVYTLWFSREGHEVIAQVDFSNDSGKKVIVVRAAPVVCGAASVGGSVASWSAVGDAKQNDFPHQLVNCGSMARLDAWWHVAVKNRENGRGLLAGSLRNRKALGRFLLTPKDKSSVRLVGYSDYESVEMPPGARIEGEPFLLCFGPTGNGVLERFGELVAKANGINLLRDHPIDSYTPRGLNLFTSLSQWGASVIIGFKYEFDKSKGHRALFDPVWAKPNEAELVRLGLTNFGYGVSKKSAGIFSLPAPLARRYGIPDPWSQDLKQITNQYPEYYITGRVDFSHPEVQQLERQRVSRAFAQAKGPATYFWDFTEKWRRLEGQHDPFMTSADTYHAGMSIWREAARQHPAGAYSYVWMNVVGLNYDLVDIIHIGHDSDKSYGGEGMSFTHGLTRQITGRYFYNGRVWWNNPDSFHVYAGGIYSAKQAKVHASFASLSGNVVYLGEPLAHQTTPPDRVEIARRVAPATPDVSRAVDIFENNPARLWSLPVKRSFGSWTVAGLFNVDFDGNHTPITQEVRFADMDLDSGKEYLVYEFWNQKFLGAVRGGFSRTLEGPDCEIYAIVENQNRPVLLSTSRHVRQMAYDILDCRWDAAKRVLTGRSLVVAGDPYQLRIHVPSQSQAKGATAGGSAAKMNTQDSILIVDFPANARGETAWEIQF